MTRTPAGPNEAAEFLKANGDVQAIDMMIVDMNGILRGKQLGRDYLASLYGKGVRLPGSNYLLNWRGENIPTLTYGTSDGDPDWFCHGVKGTLQRVPWAQKPAGQVLCSMVDDNGAPHFADPRHLVQKALAPLADMGLTPVVAIEYEFYLIDQKAAAKGKIRAARSPETGWRNSSTSVYDLDDIYDFAPLLDDIHTACQALGIPAETIVSEYAPGQYEINLHHCDDALKACDQAILLERVIKQVARRHGVIASFMAKPFAGTSGSGLHVHVSLLDKNGRNVMTGPMDKAINKPVSDVLRHGVGGLMATMGEAMAIFAPNANSYRRLRPGTYAPVRAMWSGDNRTVPLRVPGGEPGAMRIEHRTSGADANPYLVMAAVLAGLHHGIANEIMPPAPVAGDGYDSKAGSALPVYWPLALEAFEAGTVLPEYLGKQWHRCFAAARRSECEDHHAAIPALDYDWYLRTA